PKFPCAVRLFRLGDEVRADATHQGTTFMTYRGRAGATVEPDGVEHTEHEWWIKCSRAVGGGAGYDLPPRVVQVTTSGVRTHTELVDGELTLRDSDWDPYTALLPVRGAATAELVTTRHTGRSISAAGELDPDAFWPFADTIGGSRWPGDRGAPRRPPAAPGGAR
ncbi:MAG: acetoacetate decarboxylase, partial [Actinomycetes bacterium]